MSLTHSQRQNLGKSVLYHPSRQETYDLMFRIKTRMKAEFAATEFHIEQKTKYFGKRGMLMMLGPILYVRISKFFAATMEITVYFKVLAMSGRLRYIFGHMSPLLFALVMIPATMSFIKQSANRPCLKEKPASALFLNIYAGEFRLFVLSDTISPNVEIEGPICFPIIFHP